METRVAEIINQVLALPPADKARVRQALMAEQPADAAADALLRFKQQLLAAGLISEIKEPTMTGEEFNRIQPIVSPGQPLSEMIIEDRR